MSTVKLADPVDAVKAIRMAHELSDLLARARGSINRDAFIEARDLSRELYKHLNTIVGDEDIDEWNI